MINNNKNWNIITYVSPILVLVIGLICFGISNYRIQQQIELTQADLASTQETLRQEVEKNTDLSEQLKKSNEIIDSREGDVYFIDCEVTEREIEMIAKTVWGEARGCNRLEQSAVVWCILNRVDDGRGSIAQVVTAPNQFHGYNSSFPVTDEIRELVEDVIVRWKLEKIICGDVGRTLPSNYLYFVADETGIGNIFKTAYTGECERWDWDCWNPYK